MNFEREEALLFGAAHVGSEGPQGVDKFGHGAMAHLGDPIDEIDATRGRGAKGGEEAGGGAGETNEEGDRFFRFKQVLLARNVERGVLGVGIDRAAELPESRSHQSGVHAKEGASQRDGITAEGSEEKRAVSEAFGAGQHHFTARGRGEGDDRQN